MHNFFKIMENLTHSLSKKERFRLFALLYFWTGKLTVNISKSNWVTDFKFYKNQFMKLKRIAIIVWTALLSNTLRGVCCFQFFLQTCPSKILTSSLLQLAEIADFYRKLFTFRATNIYLAYICSNWGDFMHSRISVTFLQIKFISSLKLTTCCCIGFLCRSSTLIWQSLWFKLNCWKNRPI